MMWFLSQFLRNYTIKRNLATNKILLPIYNLKLSHLVIKRKIVSMDIWMIVTLSYDILSER